MSSLAIRIENLSKRFFIGAAQQRPTTFYDAVTSTLSAPWRRFRMLSQKSAELEEFWALRDLEFDVHDGDVIGIIGRNGAGKSTLLKILSRIVEPTTGRVEIHGRVASLLEVGTGFHPELTGRENIYLNGSILGMTNKEIDAKFDAIVDFSGVEKFLETPFKRYSSGMGVRLAFAVAAHLDPEILIIDEVLAVGDAEFQKRCLGKMSEVAGAGRTVLFVSHNMAAVENLCQRVILLEQGRLVSDGSPENVIDEYLGKSGERYSSGPELPPIRGVNASLEIRGVGDKLCKPNETVEFHLEFRSERELNDVDVALGIDEHRGHRLTTLHTGFQHSSRIHFKEHVRLTARWEHLNLAPGPYWVTVALVQGGTMIALWERAVSFTVTEGDFYGTGRMPNPIAHGCMLTPVDWTVGTGVCDESDLDDSKPRDIAPE